MRIVTVSVEKTTEDTIHVERTNFNHAVCSYKKGVFLRQKVNFGQTLRFSYFETTVYHGWVELEVKWKKVSLNWLFYLY